MRYFENLDSRTFAITNDIAKSLAFVSEQKGKQDLFKSQRPEILDALKESAIVQSAESSNRIEQVTAGPGRLVDLVQKKIEPRDRSEQEIVGYRRALDLIHENKKHIPVNATTLRVFHKNLFWFDELKGGKFKPSQNEIIRKENNIERVVFVPTPAHMVEIEIERLHEAYSRLAKSGDFHPLMLVASYILDFLCIHPFSDGNGRVARLMSLLLLYHHDYDVGAFISLERIIEQNKDSYYDTLERSSIDWHDNKHDAMPWIEYFIGVVLSLAYKEFEAKVNSKTDGETKTEAVINTLRRLPKFFKFSDIQHRCPHVSAATIKTTLAELKKTRLVKCAKRGRDATWEKASVNFWDESIPEDRSDLFWGPFESDLFWGPDDNALFWDRHKE